MADVLHILNLAEGKAVVDENKKAKASKRKDFVWCHGFQKILMVAPMICDAKVLAGKVEDCSRSLEKFGAPASPQFGRLADGPS
jgi:hypothetical protein